MVDDSSEELFVVVAKTPEGERLYATSDGDNLFEEVFLEPESLLVRETAWSLYQSALARGYTPEVRRGGPKGRMLSEAEIGALM